MLCLFLSSFIVSYYFYRHKIKQQTKTIWFGHMKCAPIRSTKSEKMYPTMLTRGPDVEIEPYYCLPVGSMQAQQAGTVANVTWSQPTSPTPPSRFSGPLSPTHPNHRLTYPKKNDDGKILVVKLIIIIIICFMWPLFFSHECAARRRWAQAAECFGRFPVTSGRSLQICIYYAYTISTFDIQINNSKFVHADLSLVLVSFFGDISIFCLHKFYYLYLRCVYLVFLFLFFSHFVYCCHRLPFPMSQCMAVQHHCYRAVHHYTVRQRKSDKQPKYDDWSVNCAMLVNRSWAYPVNYLQMWVANHMAKLYSIISKQTNEAKCIALPFRVRTLHLYALNCGAFVPLDVVYLREILIECIDDDDTANEYNLDLIIKIVDFVEWKRSRERWVAQLLAAMHIQSMCSQKVKIGLDEF